jgi:hypothetical protein
MALLDEGPVIPEGPGLYAFTVEDSERGGGARGGQRYGRLTNAGVTGQRINVAIGSSSGQGEGSVTEYDPSPSSQGPTPWPPFGAWRRSKWTALIFAGGGGIADSSSEP